MLTKDTTYVVMGLLDSDSIAYSIGKTIEQWGGKVIFTVQSERMKRIFLDRSKKLSDEEKAALNIKYCGITIDEEVKTLFSEIGPIGGVIHSIAFANPKTCMGEEFHTDAYEDLKAGFHISAVSLATVVRYAQPHVEKGGGIVALTFASELAFPYYNWMGVNKAALEAVVRALARRHGKDNLHINAVSAGPVATKAAGAIPGFSALSDTWSRISPLPWGDSAEDKQEIAHAAVFLLGPCSKKITGQVLYVDGGASVIGGELVPSERPRALRD
ncbi:MAG: SDR family oxidoreductase [Kiritimatiellae bacterium]|nr:SDR family oxidoreductase [Kiritimatiellia bacterium]